MIVSFFRLIYKVKTRTPKVTLYTDQAKCMLMENAPNPDFTAEFYDGRKTFYPSLLTFYVNLVFSHKYVYFCTLIVGSSLLPFLCPAPVSSFFGCGGYSPIPDQILFPAKICSYEPWRCPFCPVSANFAWGVSSQLVSPFIAMMVLAF